MKDKKTLIKGYTAYLNFTVLSNTLSIENLHIRLEAYEIIHVICNVHTKSCQQDNGVFYCVALDIGNSLLLSIPSD